MISINNEVKMGRTNAIRVSFFSKLTEVSANLKQSDIFRVYCTSGPHHDYDDISMIMLIASESILRGGQLCSHWDGLVMK